MPNFKSDKKVFLFLKNTIFGIFVLNLNAIFEEKSQI